MTDREKFEAWYCADAKAQGCSLPDGIADLRDGDGYGAHRVMLNGKWQGWQASRKQVLEQALEELESQSANGGRWLSTDAELILYRIGADSCVNAVKRLANPEGEQE